MLSHKYGLHNYASAATLSELLTCVECEDNHDSIPAAVQTLTSTPTLLANYWVLVVHRTLNALERTYDRRDERPLRDTQFKSLFSEALLQWVMLNSTVYINSTFEDMVERTHPKLSLIKAISLASWQAYMERMPVTEQTALANVLNALPAPFEDARFSVVPMHTNSYRRGHCHSPWLRDIEGHYVHRWDPATHSRVLFKLHRASDSLFMDAKLGLLFLFQGKPSISVSFHVDQSGHVFIHQVQAKIKDRGHYKLGEQWRTRVIDYMRHIFQGRTLYLIHGEDAANDVSSAYGDVEQEVMRPSTQDLAHIRSVYNQWPGIHPHPIQKSKTRYHRILCTGA